jgi:hypothetical protein
MFKKFLINLVNRYLTNSELKKILLSKDVVLPLQGVNFETSELVNLWREIINKYPFVEKYIAYRKNLLLHQMFVDKDKEFLEGAISELVLLESLINAYKNREATNMVSSDWSTKKENKTPEDIERSKLKLKEYYGFKEKVQ